MKIGALVPVRLSSQRMPGKALMPIMGRPAILHLLDRLFASRHLKPHDVILCTTTDQSDDPLLSIAESVGARVFRGSRDNIIDRFNSAVAAFGFDALIQADGDDPCSDTTYMDLCMDRLLADPELGIVLTEGLPLGLGSKAIRASAIRTVWNHHLTQQNDTGFIYYFTRTGLCRMDRVKPLGPEHVHGKARLTLDYPEDLAFFEALFMALYQKETTFGIEEIVSLLNRRPELLEINSMVDEDYWKRTHQLAQLEYQMDGKTFKIGDL
jgi:spore coat polysaccharide biosynthesis protein SpsF